MDGYRFDNVSLLLAEPNWQVRESIKSRLHHEGFRNVFTIDRIDKIRRAVEALELDLIIADTDLPDGDVCELFHAIRHHETGNNPFIAIIATSRSTHTDMVRRVIDSGADDLLVKPMSTDHLVARIKQLVRRRKPFLVTSTYIGPDRRRQPTREGDPMLLEVPNPLHVKATGEAPPENIQDAISSAVIAINEQRIDRHAAEIRALAARIVEAHHQGRSAEQRGPDLERLLFVAEDIERRLAATRYDHVSELCGSLMRVAGALVQAGDTPNPKDLQLLPEVAQAVESAFRLGEGSAEISHDISRSVAEASLR